MQIVMGLTMATIIEGTMLSIEPSKGAAAKAISVWTTMAANMPTKDVVMNGHSSW